MRRLAAVRGVGRACRRWWIVGAAMLLAVAAVASVLGPAMWGRAVQRDRQHAFEAEATAVASAVATSMQRLQDLTGTMAAMYQQNPHLTYEQFSAWVDA